MWRRVFNSFRHDVYIGTYNYSLSLLSLSVYTTKTYKGFVWTLISQNGNENDSFRLLYFCWRNSRIRNEIKFVKTWQCWSHFSYSCARTHTHTHRAARHSTLVRLSFWIKSKSDKQIVVQMYDRRNEIGMKRHTHTHCDVHRLGTTQNTFGRWLCWDR